MESRPPRLRSRGFVRRGARSARASARASGGISIVSSRRFARASCRSTRRVRSGTTTGRRLIQAAYRRHQERTETARRARTKAFEALEEADEAMINGRKGLMTKLQSKLSGGLAGKLSRGMQRSRVTNVQDGWAERTGARRGRDVGCVAVVVIERFVGHYRVVEVGEHVCVDRRFMAFSKRRRYCSPRRRA